MSGFKMSVKKTDVVYRNLKKKLEIKKMYLQNSVNSELIPFFSSMPSDSKFYQ